VAKEEAKQDSKTSTRKVVILAALLAAGAMVLGAALLYFWQNHAKQEKAKPPEIFYLSLGERAMAIGDHSMLIGLTVEYAGRDTGDSLTRALPHLKNQVMRRMSQIQPSDLRRLRTPQGKRELADDILVRVREAVPDKDAANVKAILYEKFLIGD